jgi:putative transposase
MDDYHHGAHSVFSIHLHLVWITKYRKPVLMGDIALKTRDILREICRSESVEIIRGNVSRDHIHMFVSIPPQVTISRLVQKLKGKSLHKLLHTFPSLRRQYWGRHFWARGYFCCSSGNVTDEIIKQYIEQQSHDDDTFKVQDEG